MNQRQKTFGLFMTQKTPCPKINLQDSCFSFWKQSWDFIWNYYTGFITKLRDNIVEEFRGKLSKAVIFMQDSTPAYKLPTKC